MAYPDLRAEVRIPPDLPWVLADADKVEQVLTNLVENAAKYADPARVRIVASHDGDSVTVAVEDHGAGIGADDLPRVFDRFFRRDHGRPTGTGLGLWISTAARRGPRGIAHRHLGGGRGLGVPPHPAARCRPHRRRPMNLPQDGRSVTVRRP